MLQPKYFLHLSSDAKAFHKSLTVEMNYRMLEDGEKELDGGKYKGKLLDGKAHGYGTWTSGCGQLSYKGHWKNDQYHGYGVNVYKKGDTYNGEWKNGKWG